VASLQPRCIPVILVILDHVEDSDKRMIEEIVRQVGYLPELYKDAWSEKYV
jgi:hypothetical protein